MGPITGELAKEYFRQGGNLHGGGYARRLARGGAPTLVPFSFQVVADLQDRERAAWDLVPLPAIRRPPGLERVLNTRVHLGSSRIQPTDREWNRL